ncbi:MAG: helix-turn-helix transcriptional regulator [Anaerolineales bacterium]
MTNAEIAILGLVAEAPRHGYEIEQLVEQRGMRNWTEVGFSSIYYILNKLEQRGWIKSQPEPAAWRGPTRKVFAIQPAGQKAWAEATLEALSNPRPKSPFLLGLAGLPGIRPQDSASALRQYRQSVLKRREEVQNAWESAGQPPLFLEGMFEYSLNMLQTELDWLDRYIPRLESLIT